MMMAVVMSVVAGHRNCRGGIDGATTVAAQNRVGSYGIGPGFAVPADGRPTETNNSGQQRAVQETLRWQNSYGWR